MSGVVVVMAQESARFNWFTKSLSQLDMPDGWEVQWRFGWDLADGYNALIRQFRATGKDHIWFMGDDHAFSPDILRKLLAHDVEMVLPLCLMRAAPYRPVNWVRDDSEPEGVARIDLTDYPDGGLVPIEYAGAAGLLVHRSVFDKFDDPWFECGTGITNRVGEDINFCKKAREAGVPIWLDLDTVLGHCCTTVVWPVREPDGWTFAFSMVGGFEITLPPTFQTYADDVAR